MGGSEKPVVKSVTRLIRCPKCSWVGAIIEAYDFMLKEETGSWRCLRFSCRHVWEDSNPTVLDSVPDKQLQEAREVLYG